jgi:hypothetical protein
MAYALSKRARSICLTSVLSIALGMGCSKEQPPPPPPPEAAGIVLKLSLGPQFRASLVKGIDFVVDAAPAGPRLGIAEFPRRFETYNNVRYELEGRSVDSDVDEELVGYVAGNLFAQGAVEVFVPTAAVGTNTDKPFLLRLAARGDGGALGGVDVLKRDDGTPLRFPATGRFTVTASIPCLANISCVQAGAANRPPVMASFGAEPFVVRRWWPIEIRPRAYDPDDDKVTFSVPAEDLAALPGGATFKATTQVFEWTPPVEALTQNGMPRTEPYRVRFRANDGKGGEVEQTALIKVVQPNSNPVWTPVPPLTALEQAELVVQVSVKDPDGGKIDLELDLAKLPPGANALLDEDTGTLTWTPSYDDARPRPWTARIFARDDNGGVSILSIPITVIDRNRPPIVTAPSETTIRAGAQATIQVTGVDPDAEAVTLEADLTGLPAASGPGFDAATGTFRWTPAAGDARDAPYTVRFTAKDPRGAAATVVSSLRVHATNSAPVIAALRYVALQEGETATFPVTATDPDNDTVEVTMDASGLPQGHGATFASGTFRFTPQMDMARSEPFRVAFTARDSKGATTTTDVLILVNRFIPGAPTAPIFTGTTPASPSNVNSITVSGTAQPEMLVTIYRNADCSGDSNDTGEANAQGRFDVQLDVPDNSTTTFSATATNVNNERVSACSTVPLNFVEDSTAPAQPTLAGPQPASPANNNMPQLSGTAEAGSTVRVFTNANCQGAVAAMTAADTAGNYSIVMTVADNSSTFFTVNALDAAGNVSSCSGATQYVEDSVVPATPVFSGSTPGSPANNNDPVIRGAAPQNVRVRIFRDAACTQQVVEVMSTMAGTFEATPHVDDNTTTSFYAKSVSIPVGNESPCTATPLVYVEDSIAPPAPTVSSTIPPSPNNNATTIEILGTAEGGATVRLFLGQPQCQGTPVATTTANASGGFNKDMVQVAANTTTQITAQAVDAAGNPSPCSAPLSYFHDSDKPAPPVFSTTDPVSPSNMTPPMPILRGTAESGGTLRIFTQPACAGPLAASTVLPATQPVMLQQFAIAVPALPNDTTTFYGTVTDSAGNTSDCSPSTISFSHDNEPPAKPDSISVTPTSPSQDQNPLVKGSVDGTAVSVRIYKGMACPTASPAAMGNPATFNGTGIPVTVDDNVATVLRVTALDQVGNESECSDPITYIHDSKKPDPPTLTTDPASPSKTDTSPSFKGTAEAGSRVHLWANDTCTGSSLIDGTAADFASAGFEIVVGDNQSLTVRATATDLAGNKSDCSAPVTYRHDGIDPQTPTGLSTVEVSPNPTVQNPKVKGTVTNEDPTSIVKLYKDASCTGDVVGMGTVAEFAGAGITATLDANTTTSIRAKAFDASTRESGCSAPVSYTHDNQPPSAPTLTATTPTSPTNKLEGDPEKPLEPLVKGTVDSGAGVVTVRIYKDSCNTAALATGPVADFTGAGLKIIVLANSTNTLRTDALDAAGNVSQCSQPATPFVYVHDTIKPAKPSALVTVPATTGSDAAPKVKGTIDLGDTATVQLFKNADCSGSPAATGTAADFTTGAGIAINVDPNVSTQIRALALDAATNKSDCSDPVAYLHDNVAPDHPASLTLVPASPNASHTPVVKGTAEAGSTIKIYDSSACSGTPLATDTRDKFESDGIQVTLPMMDKTTTLFVTATDAAGNVKTPCTASIAYTRDASPPPAPVVSGTTPASPSRTELSPHVLGTAEANATVEIFKETNCAGAVVGTGTANGSGSFDITLSTPVTANSSTTFFAKATDTAGNPGACSTAGFTYVHDTLTPTTVTVSAPDGLFLGKTLTCTADGSTFGTETVTYEFQWQRDNVDIMGATAANYTILAGDRGKAIRCNARARAGTGPDERVSGFVSSSAVTPVNRAPAAFTSSVSGLPSVGSVLTCSGDFVSPDEDGEAVTRTSVLWESSADGSAWSPITGQTGDALSIDSGLLSRFVRCTMTVTDAGGASTTSPASSATGPVIGPITSGPVVCAKPPLSAYYKAGMAVGTVANVTCATSDANLVPFVVSSTCSSLSFTGNALTGTVPAASNGCHVVVGARTSGGFVCSGCSNDTVKLRLAKPVRPPAECSDLGPEPSSFVVFTDGSNDKLFFTQFADLAPACAVGGARPFKLMVTDGTAAGTVELSHANVDGSVPASTTRLGPAIRHAGAFYVNVGDVILKSTGAGGDLTVFATGVGDIANTKFVRQIVAHDGLFFALTDDGIKKISGDGATVSAIADTPGAGPMVVFNGDLYFGFRGVSGTQLTKLSTPYDEIAPATATLHNPDSLAVFASKLFFSGHTGTATQRKLLSFDGTSTFNTEFDVPGYAVGDHNVLGLSVHGGVLYFVSQTGEADVTTGAVSSIYRFDGTTAKRLVTTITPGETPKSALLAGIGGILGVVRPKTMPVSPYTLQAYPLDSSEAAVALHMTGPFYDRTSNTFTIGTNQLLAFPAVTDVASEEYGHRIAFLKGEVYFAGTEDIASGDFDLWKLTDPKATDPVVP